MKRNFITEAEAKKRKLKGIKVMDVAEFLFEHKDELNGELITYYTIYQSLGVPYPPASTQTNGHLVALINDAFDKLKLKCRLFIVYDEGAKLYSDGEEAKMLVKQRIAKNLNAVKRTKLLLKNRGEVYSGKMGKFLERQVKVQNILLETQMSYLEMDGLFTSEETAKMLPE